MILKNCCPYTNALVMRINTKMQGMLFLCKGGQTFYLQQSFRTKGLDCTEVLVILVFEEAREQ